MKILLCCVAGVTSTLFASKLKDAALRKVSDVTVWSASEHAVEYSIDLAAVSYTHLTLPTKAEV